MTVKHKVTETVYVETGPGEFVYIGGSPVFFVKLFSSTGELINSIRVGIDHIDNIINFLNKVKETSGDTTVS